MAEIKTKIEPQNPFDYLENLGDARRNIEGRELINLLQDITGNEPKMWGASIIGFDEYEYKYESGHSGKMCKIGFSPRKTAHTLYLNCNAQNHEELLSKLGKYKNGKGCLYIKKLTDVDLGILREILTNSYRNMCAQYP